MISDDRSVPCGFIHLCLADSTYLTMAKWAISIAMAMTAHTANNKRIINLRITLERSRPQSNAPMTESLGHRRNCIARYKAHKPIADRRSHSNRRTIVRRSSFSARPRIFVVHIHFKFVWQTQFYKMTQMTKHKAVSRTTYLSTLSLLLLDFLIWIESTIKSYRTVYAQIWCGFTERLFCECATFVFYRF